MFNSTPSVHFYKARNEISDSQKKRKWTIIPIRIDQFEIQKSDRPARRREGVTSHTSLASISRTSLASISRSTPRQLGYPRPARPGTLPPDPAAHVAGGRHQQRTSPVRISRPTPRRPGSPRAQELLLSACSPRHLAAGPSNALRWLARSISPSTSPAQILAQHRQTQGRTLSLPWPGRRSGAPPMREHLQVGFSSSPALLLTNQ